jgi:predicted TIM-barrel fold metal-dependent hydrolase
MNRRRNEVEVDEDLASDSMRGQAAVGTPMTEDILDPDLVICDPHHHMWEVPHNSYKHPYPIGELMSDVGSGHRIEKTVFIECRERYRSDGPEAFRSVGEVEYVVASEPRGFIAGIVGFVDLRIPEVKAVLEALVEAGAGRFRGIRQISVWDADPTIPLARPNDAHMLLDPAFRSGLAALGRAGLSFDAWMYHPQLDELTDLARTYPDVSIVLNHFGGPLGIGTYADHQSEVRERWRTSMRMLSGCPNVTVKLGGVGSPFLGKHWDEIPGGVSSDVIADAVGDDFRWCIEEFGVDRCMFESNFPADRDAFSYATIWNAYKKIVAGASESEKRALFHDTATRIYRI